MRIGLALIWLPSELIDHAGEDAIGLPHVPGIVKAPDDEVMCANERELLLQDGVVGERRLIIGVVIEGRLVRNDQVLAGGDRLFEDDVCVHESCGDARDLGVGVTGLERVHSIGWRSGSGRCDDSLHHLGGGEGGTLCERGPGRDGEQNNQKRILKRFALEHGASAEICMCEKVYPLAPYGALSHLLVHSQQRLKCCYCGGQRRAVCAESGLIFAHRLGSTRLVNTNRPLRIDM
jgi:hypothetical protein